MIKKRAYGTYEMAEICHVSPVTVCRWIEGGKLPSFTTGGGHRRVWDTDLVRFLKRHNYPVPKGLQSTLAQSVLVVEDETATRRFIHRAVEKVWPTAHVYEAVDGFEAGEKIFDIHPSLVILDIWLPGIDGIKVCQRVRQDKRFKDMKIMAITADPDEGVKEKILDAGADAFMSKPFSTRIFEGALLKLAGHPATPELVLR